MKFLDENRTSELWQAVKNKVNSLVLSITTAQQTANNAAEAASQAQSSANNAKSAADNAQSTANAAKTTAEAALPKSGGTMTGPIIGIQTPTVDTGAANKQYVDSSIVRQNLADNHYFLNPVNQRGKTEYVNDGYTIDRWKIIGVGSVTVGENGLTLTRTGAEYFDLRSLYILPEIIDKVATFSILSDGVVYSVTAKPLTSTPATFPNFQILTSYVDNTVFLVIRPTNTTPLNIQAVKLELGSTQTLAHKEGDTLVLNEIPDYATELLKCQRYQLAVIESTGAYGGIIGYGRVQIATACWVFIPTPIKMRTVPSLVFNSGSPTNMQIAINGTLYKVTAVTAIVLRENGVLVNVTSSNMPVSHAGMVYFTSPDALFLNANL